MMSVDDPDAEADSIQGSMNFTIHFISLHITSHHNDAEDDEDELTSISAISYQETRRARQRTGAHGWQSLSSLSR